jgi:hypothetical protein
MTTSLIKVKVVRRPALKVKVLPRFPVSVSASSPILLDKTGGKLSLSLDILALEAVFSTIYQPISNHDQEITSGPTAAIATTTDTARVNQTVGAPITLQLGASASRTTPLLISDWKGDAGTNNITILPNGTEKIQGRSSWVIAADLGSICLRPIAGVGWAL